MFGNAWKAKAEALETRLETLEAQMIKQSVLLVRLAEATKGLGDVQYRSAKSVSDLVDALHPRPSQDGGA